MRTKSAPFLPEKSLKGGLKIISSVTSYFCKELGIKLLERVSFLQRYEFRDIRLKLQFWDRSLKMEEFLMWGKVMNSSKKVVVGWIDSELT